MFEESEEEKSVTLSVDRLPFDGVEGQINLNVVKRDSSDQNIHSEDPDKSVNTTRKRVMVEGENLENESFFIEEIIEESEDETSEEEGVAPPQV